MDSPASNASGTTPALAATLAIASRTGVPVDSQRNPHSGSEWMAKHDAQAHAVHLSRGPTLAAPSSDIAFNSTNHARVYIMAYALQNNFSSPTAWTSRAARKKMIKMVCYRKMNAWIGRVHGDCNWNIVVGFAGGKQTVVGNFVHGHELDGMKPAESPMKKGRSGKSTIQRSIGTAPVQHSHDGSSSEESVKSSDDNSEDGSAEDSGNAAFESDSASVDGSSGEEEVVTKTFRATAQEVEPLESGKGVERSRTEDINRLAQELVDSGMKLRSLKKCRANNAKDLQIALTAYVLSTGYKVRYHHMAAVYFDLRCNNAGLKEKELRCRYKVFAKLKEGVWRVTEVRGEHNHGPVAEPVVQKGARESGAGKKEKRAREEEVFKKPATKPRVSAPKSIHPLRRLAQSDNAVAVASGSESRGIPATQYHTGSASHNDAAPQNTAVTPTAPLSWPRELARLVASVNPLLLRKSHTFAKLLIPIGVVNRHEFSKMIWSFGATDQHDKRMNWFKIHLRKGNELVEMDFMQFRIGATRICKGIPVMAS